jgi:hypothetical protein
LRGANISTLFGQAAGQCHIIGPLLQPNRRNISQFSSKIIESRAGNDGMPTTNALDEPRDEHCGIW